MELSTIDMPREQAQGMLDDYRAEVTAKRSDEDRRIMAGLRAVVRGYRLIKLTEAFETGGTFDSGLPRLAVARVDTQRCFVFRDIWRQSPAFVFGESLDAAEGNRSALVTDGAVRVNTPKAGEGRDLRGSTIVPNVPPGFRHGRKLSRFHILWEVESWEPIPPKDPALIKWIGGDLWAVHAVWDLTELERAVLTGTRR